MKAHSGSGFRRWRRCCRRQLTAGGVASPRKRATFLADSYAMARRQADPPRMVAMHPPFLPTAEACDGVDAADGSSQRTESQHLVKLLAGSGFPP